MNLEDENSALGVFSVKHLMERGESKSSLVTGGTLKERGDEVNDNMQLPLITEYLKALTVSVQVLEHKEVLNPNTLRLMVSCQRTLSS